jgi:hypothetical protein
MIQLLESVDYINGYKFGGTAIHLSIRVIR